MKGNVYIGESFLFCTKIKDGNFDRMWYRLSGIRRKNLYFLRMMDIISKQFTFLLEPLCSYCSYLQKRKRKEQQKSILYCCKKGLFWQADNLGGEKSVVSKYS